MGGKLGGHYLELGQALDGLQRPQHPQHPQGLDGLDVPPFVGSAGEKPPGNHSTGEDKSDVHTVAVTPAGETRGEVGKEGPPGRPRKTCFGKISKPLPDVHTLTGTHTHASSPEEHTGTHRGTEHIR